MAGVSDDAPYSVEIDGVTYEARKGSDGKLHYAGFDKDGQRVTTPPPSSFMSAATQFFEKPMTEAPSTEAPKGAEEQPKSGDEDKDKKRSSENRGVSSNSDNPSSEKQSATREVMEALSKKYKGLYCTSFDPKSGEIKGKLSDGTEFELTSEEQSSLRNALRKDEFHKKYQGGSSRNISFMDELTAGWKNMKAAWKDMKQDAKETVDSIKLRIQDVKKGFSLIAQGKFRELTGRAALRLNDNLEAMGILPKRVNDAVNRKIEGKLGIKEGEREHKSYKTARNWGNIIRTLRGAVRAPERKVDRSNVQPRTVNPAYVRNNGGRQD